MASPNQPIRTEVLRYGKATIARAAALIAQGQPVAVPTETVYGLAADATNGEAVARIYAAKGRPSFNPLIVHVRSLAHAEEIGLFSDTARALAERWWPGALTVVVPLRPGSGIAPIVTAGLDTIALRCPDHPVMQALLEATDKPLAAPSANASGTISPTSADHVLKTLEGRIPLVINGEATALGLESTIVGVGEKGIRLLRPGPISFDEIVEASGLKAEVAPDRIEAPGQLQSHYAPAKPLRLDTAEARSDEWLIGFGPVEGSDNLSPAGSLVEAAANLFGALHRAETSGKATIAVAPMPETGLGAAINDRLRRAAAPR